MAASLLTRTEELGARMARHIRAQVPYYRGDEHIPFAELTASCRRNCELVLQQLVDGRDGDMAPARETGRERARQGTPLAELLHAYRVGSEILWSAIATEARSAQGLTTETIMALAAWWVNGGLAASASDAYREEVSELVLQRERERSAMVEALFTGLLADRTTLWDAADVLGLPTGGPYVVVAAEVPGPGREALPGVEARLRAEQLRSAWRLLPDLQVGVVAVPHPEADDAVLRVLERSLAAHVGISPAYRDLRETPKALRLARLALTDARGRPATGIARFDNSPAALLVAAAPDEAGRIARAALDGVLRLPADERDRLLETLECWFAAAGSTVDAAELLYCHRNTVRYRLRRLEELTGRSLRDPRAVADLAVALHGLRLTPGE
ncbi:transcriptional regulator, Fis family protein [Streptomyces noursei]|uniref:Transcriptional regulator, Fis family protein n=1 Tax=Streptomyces noursei TaxID=1971 RepID=A0A2N8PEI2_STRNR|nr:transcriptional regulator, Fis family protein [Streptomyces noursei]